MKPPTVGNLREGYDSEHDVYIGRANPRYRLKKSRWANPFKLGKDGTREEILAKYERYLREKLSSAEGEEWKEALLALAGKRLVCWCKPKPCHGDILARLFEELRPESTQRAERKNPHRSSDEPTRRG